nr:rRNA adenine N-6-methyltransferase family protein [Nonomuraea deserti]
MNAYHGDDLGMRLRRSLADRLTESRDLRSPLWRRAVETTPREAFLPDDVFRNVDGQWEPVCRAQFGDEAWLRMAYQDQTIVTQCNEIGEPVSSSTLPGLVVRMLEYLDLREGDKVLEIGTGTGYSTALMCQRLGPESVTSIEIDSDVAERAAAALRGLARTGADHRGRTPRSSGQRTLRPDHRHVRRAPHPQGMAAEEPQGRDHPGHLVGLAARIRPGQDDS